MVDKSSHIAIIVTGSTVDVKYSYRMFIANETDPEISKLMSCYIPSFDVYFTAKDREDAGRKSKIVTKMYIDHYMLHTKKGFKDFVLHIHKLGFKAQNDNLVLKQVLKDNQIIPAKFYGGQYNLPDGFRNAKDTVEESQFEMQI